MRGLVDAASGSVVASYEYDPFGNLLDSQGDAAALAANPFKFSTKYFDSETGLYFYGMRYYSPALGRWMTRDPLAEDGGVNVYAFVANDPVNKIDPNGLDPQDSRIGWSLNRVTLDPLGRYDPAPLNLNGFTDDQQDRLVYLAKGRNPRAAMALQLGQIGLWKLEKAGEYQKYIADHQKILRQHERDLKTGFFSEYQVSGDIADHRERLKLNQTQLADTIKEFQDVADTFSRLGLDDAYFEGSSTWQEILRKYSGSGFAKALEVVPHLYSGNGGSALGTGDLMFMPFTSSILRQGIIATVSRAAVAEEVASLSAARVLQPAAGEPATIAALISEYGSVASPRAMHAIEMLTNPALDVDITLVDGVQGMSKALDATGMEWHYVPEKLAGFATGSEGYIRTDLYDVAGTTLQELEHIEQNRLHFNGILKNLGWDDGQINIAREILGHSVQYEYQLAAGKTPMWSSFEDLYQHVFTIYGGIR